MSFRESAVSALFSISWLQKQHRHFWTRKEFHVMMSRLSLAVVFLTIAGAPFAAGSIATFAIVSTSLGLTGGVFDTGGSYFGTFSLDTSLGALISADITTTPFGAFPGEHFTAGLWGVEGTFTDPTSKVQYDSDRIVFFNQIPISLELTLLQRHGTFVGGQISDVTEVESEFPSLVRYDTSGRALLVDPALVSPEPVTWIYCLLGVAAIALARSYRRREGAGAR
jgi:hypothetical protein